jgi:hypothetical protein
VSVSIEIKGVDELVAKLDTLAKFNHVRSVISQQGVFLQRKLRQYPRAVHAPNPLIKSDPRVRRGFFYHLKHGDIRVPYKRTKRLGQSWTSYSSMNGFTVTVENNIPYAPLVQGSEEQVTQHNWSGWLTDKGAMNVYGPRIEATVSYTHSEPTRPY